MKKLLLLLCFVLPCRALMAQTSSGITVRPAKTTYDEQEKVTVEFSGLPKREAYSGRVDDVIVVPAGTADDQYGEGQRAKVSTPEGKVEFVLPKAGWYEARIYLYEQPGVVAARSDRFRVSDVAEGSLENKSEEELVRIATRYKNSNRPLMCSAVGEYFRRNPAPGQGSYPGMKALQGLCPAAAAKPAPPAAPLSSPTQARYQCYRLLSTGNEVTADLYIGSGNTYRTMGKTGKYTFNPATRIITFTSGPLWVPSEKWVGVFTGKGEPTPMGGKTVTAIIEIRRSADLKAGNKKVLQQCDCTQ